MTASVAWLLAGCVEVVHISRPVTPPAAAGGAHHATFFSHYFQLTWSGADLAELNALTIAHSRAIHVIGSPTVGDLTVNLQMDVQLENHDALISAFETRIREASRLAGSAPRLLVPASDCTESPTAVKQGICVRELTILVPSRKALALDLTWQGEASIEQAEFTRLRLNVPKSGNALVKQVRGNVQLRGGGAGASVGINGVTGSLTAKLLSISKLDLTAIAGKVQLFIDEPESARVSLDGAVIREFPFERQ